MGLFRNMIEASAGAIARAVNSQFVDWVLAISDFADAPNGPLQTHPVTQLQWFVDFNAGSDVAGNGTQAKPFKTWSQALKVWGLNAEWNAGTYEFFSVSDILLANNDLIYVPGIVKKNSALLFHGPVRGQGQAILYTSAAGMTASTAQNRAGAAGGTRGTMTDAAIPTGTWAGAGLISTNLAPNKRIRLTDGPNVGAIAWPQRDEGAGKVDVSQWLVPVLLNGPIAITNFNTAEVAPVGNEHFVVERLTRVDMLIVNAVFEDDSTGNTAHGRIGIDSLDVGTYAIEELATIVQTIGVFFWGCSSLSPEMGLSGGAGFYQQCHTKGGSFAFPTQITSCACHQTASWAPQHGCSLFLDGDTICEGVPMVSSNARGNVKIGTAACFNSTSDGVVVPHELAIRTISTVYLVGGLLWGSGNANSGLNVLAGGRFGYRNPTPVPPVILGAAGKDFTLGGSNLVRSWIEGTSAYTAPIATTWANLAAAQPAGLGGNATNLVNFAQIFAIA